MPQQAKVGSVVEQDGKRYRVTKVDAQGNVSAASPIAPRKGMLESMNEALAPSNVRDQPTNTAQRLLEQGGPPGRILAHPIEAAKGVGRGLLAPLNLAEEMTAGARTPEEAALVTKFGENVPPILGQPALAFKRIVADPMAQGKQEFTEAMNRGDIGEAARAGFKASVPVAGGMGAYIGKQLEQGNEAGLLGEFAAPWVAQGARSRAIGKLKEKAANISSSPVFQAARREGIDVTKGQVLGGVSQDVDNILRGSMGGAGIMERKGVAQAAQITKSAETVFSKISKSKLSPVAAGERINQIITAVDNVAGKRVGQTLDAIVKEIPQATISKQGAIQQGARDLMNELSRPARSFDVEKMLKSEDIKPSMDVIRGFASGKANASLADVVQLKRDLDSISKFERGKVGDKATRGSSAMQRLSGIVNEEIDRVAQLELAKKGNTQLLSAYKDEKSRFGAIQQVLQGQKQKTISQLMGKASPEQKLDAILSDASETRTAALQELLKQAKMNPKALQPVYRTAVEEAFRGASEKGIPLTESFRAMREKVPDSVWNRMSGNNATAQQLHRVFTLIDGLELDRALTTSRSARGGLGLLTGGLSGAGTGALLAPFTGMEVATGAVGGGLLFAGGVLAIPAAIAKITTRPGGLVRLEAILANANKANPTSTIAAIQALAVGGEAQRRSGAKK